MVNIKQEKKYLDDIAKYLDKLKVKYEEEELETAEGEAFPALFTEYKYKNYEFEVHIIINDDWICVKCFILDCKGLEETLMVTIFRVALELNFELPETTFSLNDGELYLEADMNVKVDFEEFKREWESIGEGLDTVMEELSPRAIGFKSTTEDEEEPAPAKPAKKKAAKKKKTSKKKGKK